MRSRASICLSRHDAVLQKHMFSGYAKLDVAWETGFCYSCKEKRSGARTVLEFSMPGPAAAYACLSSTHCSNLMRFCVVSDSAPFYALDLSPVLACCLVALIHYCTGGKHRAHRPNPAFYLLLSGPAPCFYLAAAPSSLPLVKE